MGVQVSERDGGGLGMHAHEIVARTGLQVGQDSPQASPDAVAHHRSADTAAHRKGNRRGCRWPSVGGNPADPYRSRGDTPAVPGEPSESRRAA